MSTSMDSLAADFWKAIVGGDKGAALRIGNSILPGAPLVAVPAYGFPETPSASGVRASAEEGRRASGAPTGPGVQPDTPKSTLDGWNSDTRVSMELVSTTRTCGVRSGVTAGLVDFPVCALDPKSCDFLSHKGGGTKSKPVIRMEFPINDRDALAISVRRSSQGTKPRVFSKPILPLYEIPKCYRDEERLKILTTLELPARVFKVLIEAYPGHDGLLSLGESVRPGQASGILSGTRPVEAGAGLIIDIPSPRMGEGGFRASEFEDRPSSSSSSSEGQSGDGNDPGATTSGRGRLPLFGRRRHDFDQGVPIPSSRRSTSAYSLGHEELSLPSFGRSIAGSAPGHGGGGNVKWFTQREGREMKKRLASIEQRANKREEELRTVFSDLRIEMDQLWRAAKVKMAGASPQPPTPPPLVPDQASSAPLQAPVIPIDEIVKALLADTNFKYQLSRLVLADLDRAKFVTEADLEANIREAMVSTSDLPSEVSGLCERVVKIEHELFKPEGVIAQFRKKINFLEDRKTAGAIVRGGRAFKDQRSVEALLHIVGDKSIAQYCVDAFSMIALCEAPYQTTAEGMAVEAASFKAQYDTLLEARLSVSYQLTYPECMLKKSEKKEAAVTKGFLWTPGWSSHAVFEGTYNNGAYDQMKRSLPELRDMIQVAIDYAYPFDLQAEMHGIWTDQLLKSYTQADGFIDSLNTLYKTCQSGGMDSKESWARVQVYVMGFFEDIATVRHISATKSSSAHIWGSFKTAELLDEYVRLRFLRHPAVLSVVAMTSLQREGSALNQAIGEIVSDRALIRKNDLAISNIVGELKALKKSNPSLK